MYISYDARSADDNKKRKRHDLDDSFDAMASYSRSTATSTMFLNPPPAPSRKPSQRLNRPHNELDDFLSSDLELSFASTMSLNSPPPSPPTTARATSGFTLAPSEHNCSPMAMDISPAPPRTIFDDVKGKIQTRPRSRTFGRELSNVATPFANDSQVGSTKSGSGKRLQRAALPSEWMNSFSQSKDELPQPLFQSADASDAMEVDSILPPSLTFGKQVNEAPSSPAPLSAAPTVTGFSNLFFDAMSPEPAPVRPLKRRSVSPEGSPRQASAYRHRHSNEGESIYVQEQSSSPAPPSSPSARKFERFASTGGGLFRKPSKPLLTGIAGNAAANKRARRPTISTLVSNGLQSAFPIMDSKKDDEEDFTILPPPRRAFSAMIAVPSSDDNQSEGPEMSSPAAQAYAKRQSMRTIRRRDGTEDFRPLTGAGMLREREMSPAVHSPLRKAVGNSNSESPSSRWIKNAGLPGFGDNEAHGKILPCERVSEDGLMRINVQTMDDLLKGKFDHKIASYHVIDCRFDYEYEGGHIKGAVNINTTNEIEEFLLGEKALKPSPSCSGDNAKKTILIFHCEFSAKRAPTFAKHLRSRDRAMNNHVYPRIHYPEVYILRGGYSQYFNESARFCEPRSYVRMDDPHYARDCREDLGQFRTKTRFARTRSYAYGETSRSVPTSQQNLSSQNHRNTAPSGGGGVTSLFAAANAARTRRAGTVGESSAPGLSTLAEDILANTTGSDDSCLGGVDGSPCPPPTAKVTASGTMAMAMLNARRNSASSGRGPLQRAQTFGQCR